MTMRTCERCGERETSGIHDLPKGWEQNEDGYWCKDCMKLFRRMLKRAGLARRKQKETN